MPEYKILSAEEAQVLCVRDEGSLYDKKAIGISPTKVQRVAVAMANADGGEFTIGINDDKTNPTPLDRWNGSPNFEGFNDILQCLFELTPSLSFSYNFYRCETRPGYVLHVFIERSSSVCMTSDKAVYQRQGAASIPLKDPDKITALSFAKGASSFEDYQLTDVSPEMIVESEEVLKFSAQLSPPNDPLAYCINEALIHRDTFKPNCAGLLLFADNPQARFPRRCGTKVVFYDTRLEIPERVHLKKNIAIEGPIYPTFPK